MEINKRLVWKQSLDENIVSNKLTTPNPGVAYVVSTNKVYFNNVVLGGNEPGPAIYETRDVQN